jgi:hypothetical protein
LFHRYLGNFSGIFSAAKIVKGFGMCNPFGAKVAIPPFFYKQPSGKASESYEKLSTA